MGRSNTLGRSDTTDSDSQLYAEGSTPAGTEPGNSLSKNQKQRLQRKLRKLREGTLSLPHTPQTGTAVSVRDNIEDEGKEETSIPSVPDRYGKAGSKSTFGRCLKLESQHAGEAGMHYQSAQYPTPAQESPLAGGNASHADGSSTSPKSEASLTVLRKLEDKTMCDYESPPQSQQVGSRNETPLVRNAARPPHLNNTKTPINVRREKADGLIKAASDHRPEDPPWHDEPVTSTASAQRATKKHSQKNAVEESVRQLFGL